MCDNKFHTGSDRAKHQCVTLDLQVGTVEFGTLSPKDTSLHHNHPITSQDPTLTVMDPLTQDSDFILVSKFVEEATSTEDAGNTSQRGAALGKEELTR